MKSDSGGSRGILARLDRVALWIVASKRRWVSVIGAAVLLTVLVAVIGSTDTGPTQAQSEVSTSSTTGSSKADSSAATPSAKPRWTDDHVEYQLAIIDAGRSLPLDDPVMSQYEVILDFLEPRCVEQRRMISDMAVRSMQILADEGVSSSALSILRAAGTALSSVSGETECSGVFAAVIVLMSS